jgi:hypothetical protein
MKRERWDTQRDTGAAVALAIAAALLVLAYAMLVAPFIGKW